jgi:hypothetical protein
MPTVDVHPLEPSKAPLKANLDHNEYPATQYEFYIPAAIWSHTAVKDILKYLQKIDKNATIFKGMIGVWRGGAEDTNIYRLILKPKEGKTDPGTLRPMIQKQIEPMMAALAAWGESVQEAFMFTEQQIHVNLSRFDKKSMTDLKRVHLAAKSRPAATGAAPRSSSGARRR